MIFANGLKRVKHPHKQAWRFAEKRVFSSIGIAMRFQRGNINRGDAACQLGCTAKRIAKAVNRPIINHRSNNRMVDNGAMRGANAWQRHQHDQTSKNPNGRNDI